MTKIPRSAYTITFKLLVSAVLIWLVLRNSSFSSVIFFFSLYSLSTVGTIALLLAAGLLIAAFRWKLLLPDVGFLKILKFTVIGQFYSLVLPGQLTGEAAKAYRLSSEQSGAGSRISASVAVDKIIGLIGLLMLALIGLFNTREPAGTELISTVVVLLCGLSLTLFILGNSRLQEFILDRLARIKGRYPISARIADFLGRAAGHYGSFSKRLKVIAASLILGIAYQLSAVFITAVFAHDLGLNVGLVEWFWIFGVISVAVVLPVTIAGIGVREGLFVYFLAGLGVSHEAAIALSLSVLAAQCLAALAGALIELTEFIRKR
ncbi:MAG: hypothetical protein QOG91_153 [Candidatus Parcubacteria bacterium]|nr:hypothetical protein [Candidatus Parcubacteria bacterium]